MVALAAHISHFTHEGLRYLQLPRKHIFPELEAARIQGEHLLHAPQTQLILRQTEHLMQGIEQIPQTDYTSYRMFRRVGERDAYQEPYFLKRARLSAAALRLFLKQADVKDMVQNYLWHICEESNWVLPAHEWVPIDLFSAETGFLLAETLALLGNTLDEEVRHRARVEVERRVFDPYFRLYHLHRWYQGGNHWKGRCKNPDS